MKTHYARYDAKHPTDQMRFPYRRRGLRAARERRVQKVAHKSLAQFATLPVYLTLPFRPASCISVFSFIHVVIWKFFMVQYFKKWGLRKTPLKHVDHALDQRVPFRPEYALTYWGFVNFWIRPLAMLEQRFGSSNGAKLCAEFLDYIKLAYSEAYRVYSACMTTTCRPRCHDNAMITTIQTADPHYLCVPSLHIAVVCLGFSFYRMLFAREHFTDGEAMRWSRELYDDAVLIAETVLYVKQHSVNCIPAALYMMTRITPELFGIQDAVDFIACLFKDEQDVPDGDKAAIRSHILFMFERLLLEGTTEDDWTAPVLRWIHNYEPYVAPQP